MAIDRIARLTTPLPEIEGQPALIFGQMTGRDCVSHCFQFDVLAFSTDPNIASDDLLGLPVTVDVTTNEDDPEMRRYFHGIVDQFRFEGNDDDALFAYRLILRPFLWMLSKTSDNRIFQEKTAVEIIEQILGEYGFGDYELRLSGSYETREYCVQFGESDLNFLQRLMEFEGICYFFEFEEGAHKLIFADADSNVVDCPEAPDLRFEPNVMAGTEGIGVISALMREDMVVTAKHALNDYNFETPSTDLLSADTVPPKHAQADYERYDYPGTYEDAGGGGNLSKVRRAEDQALRHQAFAHSTASMPCSGHRFKLFDHARDAENIPFFILEAKYKIWDGQYIAGGEMDQDRGFEAQYILVPSDNEFRPAQITPRPVMKGPQTAIVVGPAGEEIYTDEYSRVKVQFYWDREGRHDENSTCFIRVSSAWAGSGWGFIQIPRIGQEVIVDFLDGNPDRPIITGRVYNAEQMPPYALPGNATQSGWKSNTSLGGGGWNELRFEDKAGDEEVYFQAQKDHNEWIKNNETRNVDNDFAETVGHDAKQDVVNDRDETVGNNKTTKVGVDRTVNIGNNDTETVGADRSLTVVANESISVGINSTESIGSNHTQTVGANQAVTVAVARADTVGASEARTVGGPQTNTIGATRSVSVGSTQSHSVGSTDSWEIGGNQTEKIAKTQASEIGKDQDVKIGENMVEAVGKDKSATIGENLNVEVGKKISIKAGDEITLTCGKAKFQLKKDGTIVLEGKDISLKGSGKIVGKASGNMTLKGSKIDLN
ncbi:type VI secretion system Vgr family protein [uncultured Shimia sp.]|uniref:type VI secretion system Vgr family protein n=1 Tax=uncultured Shimia sp. TaxID=573152 RepID=UPI0025E85C30|nr:type VI secretion system tip protein VgrG [uncultured Shimia sp.]